MKNKRTIFGAIKILIIAATMVTTSTLFMCTPSSAAGGTSIEQKTQIIEEVTPKKERLLGDVNGDGFINAIDASAILRAYVDYTAGLEPFTEEEKNVADFNGDGYIDAKDASVILSAYVDYSIEPESFIEEEEKEEILKEEEQHCVGLPAEKQEVAEVAEKIFYKPNTHYIHKASCRWCNENLGSNEKLIEITDTKDIECIRCTECNPEIEIVKEYVKTAPVVTCGVSDYDIILLRKIVSSEYGADWVPVSEKAKIVASVMNMVKDPRFPNTVSGVLATACEPWGFNRYRDYYMSDSIIVAVDYYFANQNTVFANWTCNQWWGDGYQNHFKTI